MEFNRKLLKAILKGLLESLEYESGEIQGLPGYTIEEVENFAEQYIQEIIDNAELDIEIYKVHAHGSRIYGNANEKSDLDFVIFYNGNEKEDSLFNIFNEEPYYIENISCDFNPIHLEGNSRLVWNKQIQQYINNDIDYNSILNCK